MNMVHINQKKIKNMTYVRYYLVDGSYTHIYTFLSIAFGASYTLLHQHWLDGKNYMNRSISIISLCRNFSKLS